MLTKALIVHPQALYPHRSKNKLASNSLECKQKPSHVFGRLGVERL